MSLVHITHTLEGEGQKVRQHVVSIRSRDGSLLAEFDGAKRAADWLAERHYQYVQGTDGVWITAAPHA